MSCSVKFGGARVITHFAVRNFTVYLLNIDDKSERVTVSDSELAKLLAQIPAHWASASAW